MRYYTGPLYNHINDPSENRPTFDLCRQCLECGSNIHILYEQSSFCDKNFYFNGTDISYDEAISMIPNIKESDITWITDQYIKLFDNKHRKNFRYVIDVKQGLLIDYNDININVVTNDCVSCNLS